MENIFKKNIIKMTSKMIYSSRYLRRSFQSMIMSFKRQIFINLEDVSKILL